MIAIDTNLLVYAHRADTEWHAAADGVLAQLAEGSGAWSIPWPCIHEFIAVVTNKRIFSIPSPLEVALREIECWLGAPTLTMIGESPDYWNHLKSLALPSKLSGAVIHDCHIAALCMDNGVSVLWTADRDFSRFKALKTHNPLV